MPRVCFFIPLVIFLSGCAAADIQPFAIADKVSQSMPGKGLLACTGLPVGGEKCELGFSETTVAKAAPAQAPSGFRPSRRSFPREQCGARMSWRLKPWRRTAQSREK